MSLPTAQVPSPNVVIVVAGAGSGVVVGGRAGVVMGVGATGATVGAGAVGATEGAGEVVAIGAVDLTFLPPELVTTTTTTIRINRANAPSPTHGQGP